MTLYPAMSQPVGVNVVAPVVSIMAEVRVDMVSVEVSAGSIVVFIIIPLCTNLYKINKKPTGLPQICTLKYKMDSPLHPNDDPVTFN